MENYKTIGLRPDNFKEYLLSQEVGFKEYEELGTPKGTSKGIH